MHFVRHYPTFYATLVGLVTRLWFPLHYSIKTKITLPAVNPVFLDMCFEYYEVVTYCGVSGGLFEETFRVHAFNTSFYANIVTGDTSTSGTPD